HPLLALSLNNLGGLLWARGELARAEPYWREALAMRRQLYPRERYPHGHPDLAGSLNNLGGLLYVREELAQAEPYYRDALAMYQSLAVPLADLAAEAEALTFFASPPDPRSLFLALTARLRGADFARDYPLLWRGKAALARALERRQRLLRGQANEADRR